MTPDACAALHARCFTTPAPWSRADFAAFQQDPTCKFITHPQGFALFRQVLDEAELLTLAIDPDHRRQGIAAHLLQDGLTQLADAGAVVCFLEVAADNAAAIALYQCAGFKILTKRAGYYRSSDGKQIDALVMKKELFSLLQRSLNTIRRKP